MSLFNTIATGVFKFGVSKFFDSKSTKGLSVPRFEIKRFRDEIRVPSVTGGRPTQTGRTSVTAASTGQVQRLINRHEAIMESFSTEKGAVKGKYGTQSI